MKVPTTLPPLYLPSSEPSLADLSTIQPAALLHRRSTLHDLHSPRKSLNAPPLPPALPKPASPHGNLRLASNNIRLGNRLLLRTALLMQTHIILLETMGHGA